MVNENKSGICPECGAEIGPVSILNAWDKFGKFACPECGKTIKFRSWFFAAGTLIVLFVGAERLLHWMLVSKISLPLSFFISTMAALTIMMIVPRIWKFNKAEK
ncbi:MAG: hypothetical protein GXO74_06775 [Calditrichaeota bacterium]|nr:hypothetical protein [Calditrichota bacterium]